jgi:hypothetical protein
LNARTPSCVKKHFSRFDAYLAVGGQPFDTSLWKKVSLAAGEKQTKFLARENSVYNNAPVTRVVPAED